MTGLTLPRAPLRSLLSSRRARLSEYSEWRASAKAYHEGAVGSHGRSCARPDDLRIPLAEALTAACAGRAWWMRDFWRGTGPIIPLERVAPFPRTLDADFADAALEDHVDETVAHRIRHGHDNLSTCELDAIFQAPWKGTYKGEHPAFTSLSFSKEAKRDPPWYLADEHPAIWPPRVEPINCVDQYVGEPPQLPVGGIPEAEFETWVAALVEELKYRGTTDKGHGDSSVNDGIDLDAIPLSLPTNRQHARSCAILQTAESGPPATANPDENPEILESIADDDLVYQWKIDLTAAYRQLVVSVHCLWMCIKYWDDQFWLDLRCQFGDASMVEAFQSVTVAILTVCEAAIDGDERLRALLGLPAADWRFIDSARESEAFVAWRAARLQSGLGARHVRRYKTVVYIDDFLGAVLGRRMAFAVAKVFRSGLRKFGFSLKSEKETLPSRSLLALGGIVELDGPTRGLALAPARQLRYYKQLQAQTRRRRCDVDEHEQITARMVSAALYHVAGRPWVTAHFTALNQARRRGRRRVLLGPGVRAEQQFWLRAYRFPHRLALFPIEVFPRAGSPDVFTYYYDASSEVGMGGVALFPGFEPGKLAAFYWYARWGDGETYHINVKESLAGYVGLRAAFATAQSRFGDARFASPLGDNKTQLAGARNNASRNLLIAEILREQGAFALRNSIVTRGAHVASKENLSDPLSREEGDGKGLAEFRERAQKLGVRSFVRVRLPRDLPRLRLRLRLLHAEKLSAAAAEGGEASSVPAAVPEGGPLPMLDGSSGLRAGSRASRESWTYFHSFAGLDSAFDACAPLGGKPAGASEAAHVVRLLWGARTGLTALGSFEHSLRLAREGTLWRAWFMSLALVYFSGAPCIDFSEAGCGRGTGGDSGQLFLDDVELALLIGLAIIVKEIVPGILRPHLRPVLDKAIEMLEADGRYAAGFRLLRCRRHGDADTTRERVFVVAVLRARLRDGVGVDDFFPSEKEGPTGRVLDLLDHDGRHPLPRDSVDLDVRRVEWLPPRPAQPDYDGLRLIGRYDASSEIGHHVYSTGGPAPTLRTDGTGPGLGTGLFANGPNADSVFRLSPRECLRVQSFDPDIYYVARRNGLTDQDIYRLAGNTIPVMTLRALVSNLLSLLQW